MNRKLALTREVSPKVGACELTHLERSAIDWRRAREQHGRYEEVLAECGFEIIRLDPLDDHADGVFVEDTAVVFDELAVLARPGAESRRAEVDSTRCALGRYLPLAEIEAPETLDGGDVLRVGARVFVGLSLRTTQGAVGQLAEILGPRYRVSGVPFRHCLHLKSAASQVGEQAVIYNPDFVDADVFEGLELVAVDPAEPDAGNVLWTGSEVVVAAEFQKTRRILDAAGFSTRAVQASELAKAEGGLTCCSLLLQSFPA